jgi:4,4'-diaponeurosporenoate glycosyltransferase
VIATVGAFTPLGERLKPGGGFGPCVMCNRDEYLATGGHHQVRGQVLEDIPLARLFLRHNLPVRCHVGQGIVSFRMYPGGVRELIEGWSKGMGYGAVSVHPAFSIMTAAWITGCFGAFFTPIRVLLTSEAAAAWMGAIIYLAYALLMHRILQGIGRFKWWTSALFPIPLFFFGAIMARSVLLTFLLGRVTWKGRAMNTLRRRE